MKNWLVFGGENFENWPSKKEVGRYSYNYDLKNWYLIFKYFILKLDNLK